MSLFKPRYGSSVPTISDREFLERIITEKDKLYDARFRAAEIAVASAFEAQKEAISKANSAQRDYNVVHNDLTRKMDTQYKEMMPRPETLGLFKGIDEKITTIQKNYEERLSELRMSIEKTTDELAHENLLFREKLSGITGAKNGSREIWSSIIAIAGILAVIAAAAITVIVK